MEIEGLFECLGLILFRNEFEVGYTKHVTIHLKKRATQALMITGYLLFFFFFVFLIFNFLFPNVCHWDMFFWRGTTEFTVTETIIFPYFCKINNLIFLSQWPFSLFVGKTCLSDRIFLEIFFTYGWLINLWVTFGNSFFTQKAVWTTLLSSVFQTTF